jgi:hypothetical protein
MAEINQSALVSILKRNRREKQARDYFTTRGNFSDEELQSLYNAWNSLEPEYKENLEINLEMSHKPTYLSSTESKSTKYQNLLTNDNEQKDFAFSVLVPLFKPTTLPSAIFQRNFLTPIKQKLGIPPNQPVADEVVAHEVVADEVVDQAVIPAEQRLFYQALIPSFSREDVAAFVQKMSYYAESNSIVYIFGCLFIAFINILHIVADIHELRDAVLSEEYKWSGKLVKNIENFFLIIRILLKYLYSWIKCDTPISCLRQWAILFFVFYYPPGSWMISIICKFILCFTGLDIKLKLYILCNQIYDAGVDVFNFCCAIKLALESLPQQILDLTNAAKEITPALEAAKEAVAATGQLVASTGDQLAITGQHLASTGENLAITGENLAITGDQLTMIISAAKNDFEEALLQLNTQMLPLLTAAGVSATCQIPQSLRTYLADESRQTITSISDLRDQIQALYGRVQVLGDSQLDLQQLRSEMIRLGYSTPSTFDSLLNTLQNVAGNSAVQILLNSRQLKNIFSNRPTERAIEFGGRKTRKYRKNYKNKTKMYRKKQTHKRYRKKAKKGKKSKKY